MAVSGKKDDLIARILASPAATASLSQETVPKAPAPAPAASTSEAAPAPVDDDLVSASNSGDWWYDKLMKVVATSWLPPLRLTGMPVPRKQPQQYVCRLPIHSSYLRDY